MRILIASDKFKGSLTATEAGEAIRAGLEKSARGKSFEISTIPIADGGDGMARTIVDAKDGEWIETDTEDALGRPIRAGYGWIPFESLAVIEMAEASGLHRLRDEDRDPWRASTYGTGILIRHAIQRFEAERILLGIGGSATNDGGSGLAEAFGHRFLDAHGDDVSHIPADLAQAVEIDSDMADPVPRILVACDVTNPLLGQDGCTRVYGPQKGIAEADFEKHERRLRHLVDLTKPQGPRAAEIPGSGAAGGLGFGCRVFLEADMRPGFDLVADILDLESAIAECDLVITGEGRLDAQTLQGKGPAGLAALARKHGKPVAAFAGKVDHDAREALASFFDFIVQSAPTELEVAESMARGAELLTACVSENTSSLLSRVEALRS